MICECMTMAVTSQEDTWFLLLTGHHPQCGRAPGKIKTMMLAREFILKLLDYIEEESRDTDGIREEYWDFYIKAVRVFRDPTFNPDPKDGSPRSGGE